MLRSPTDWLKRALRGGRTKRATKWSEEGLYSAVAGGVYPGRMLVGRIRQLVTQGLIGVGRDQTQPPSANVVAT